MRLFRLAPALFTAAIAQPLHASDPSVSASPGSLVGWGAPGVTRCTMEGGSFAPLGETCWFPIDLLRKEGPIAIQRTRGGVREEATVNVTGYPYPIETLTVPQPYVKLSPKDAERAKREAAEVAALLALVTPTKFSLPLAPPLADPPQAKNFGAKRVFNGESKNPHNGSDYPVPQGTSVLAPADGVVVLAKEHFFAGNSVYVDHGDGLLSMAFHLSRIDVKKGDVVTKGQKLGESGATGRVSGAHLHFGIRWRHARIDPKWLLHPEEAPAVP